MPRRLRCVCDHRSAMADDRFHADWFHVFRAGRTLRAGGVVAHATEAVWGLACVPFDRAAVERILALKGRPAGKGLIVILAHARLAEGALMRLTPRQRARVLESWPGATTWLLPNIGLPGWIHGGHERVALRVPGHEQARRLCAAAGGCLVSTSANRAGRPPARTALAVRRHLGRGVDQIVPGVLAGGRAPSAIRDAESGELNRPGG